MSIPLSFKWNKGKSSARTKVLMVDDEEKFTRITRRSLEMRGNFDVKVVNHATEALDAARAFRPDVILLDVMMPDGDGGEVAAQIMRDPDVKQTPILFLTAAVKANELDRGAGRIGGRLYIAKPVNLDDLISHIEGSVAV